MDITFDPTNATDAAIVQAIIAALPKMEAVVVEPESEPKPEPEPEETPKPRRRRRTKAEMEAARAAEAAAKAAEEAEDDEDDEDDEDEEDVDLDDLGDEDEGATVADAKAAAMELVKQGKQNVIKAALKQVGATRVTELGQDQVAGFLKALK